MSLFISPQDYITMANECEQISFNICNHIYRLWCKKDKIEDIRYIFDKIFPIIEKTFNKNNTIPMDKLFLMSMIDILFKDKEYKKDNTEVDIDSIVNNFNDLSNNKMKQFEDVKQDMINDFIEILTYIKDNIK